VKLLKPNPAGCWHCVPAMMHGLAVLCGPSTLARNGVPAPGKSVSATAEAVPVSANIAAVAPIPIHGKRDFPNMMHSLALKKAKAHAHDSIPHLRGAIRRRQSVIFGQQSVIFGQR